MAAAALMNRSRPFMSRCLPRFEVSCVAFTEHVQKSSPWLHCRDGRILSSHLPECQRPTSNDRTAPHGTRSHTLRGCGRGSLAPLLAPPPPSHRPCARRARSLSDARVSYFRGVRGVRLASLSAARWFFREEEMMEKESL